MPPEECRRRRLHEFRTQFFEILERKELEEFETTEITSMMGSSCSHFAVDLDNFAIHNILTVFETKYFCRYFESVANIS